MMETIMKYLTCFSVQVIALFICWQFIYGSNQNKSIFNSSTAQESPYVAIYITSPTEEVAKTLGKGLVQGRLAACVNIIPRITSVYSWKGKIEEDLEILMLVKTKRSLVPAVVKYIKSTHPYEVPEVISVPIQGGNSEYLKWIAESVRD